MSVEHVSAAALHFVVIQSKGLLGVSVYSVFVSEQMFVMFSQREPRAQQPDLAEWPGVACQPQSVVPQSQPYRVHRGTSQTVSSSSSSPSPNLCCPKLQAPHQEHYQHK